MIIQCPHCDAEQDHFWWDGLYHPNEPCVGPPNPPETVACITCESPIPNPHAETYPNLPDEDTIQDRIRHHNHPDRPPYGPSVSRIPDAKKKFVQYLADKFAHKHDNRIPPDMERKNLDCDLCENIGWIADGFMLGENDEVLIEQYTGPCPECAVIPTGYYNE